MPEEEISIIESTRQSLKRLAEYDVSSLSRKEELGKTFSFDTAIEPATRVIGIFKQIPTHLLKDLPDNELVIIQEFSDSFFHLLNQIHEFDPQHPNMNTSQRDAIVTNIENHYQHVFTKLFPYISYLSVRMSDFTALEIDARAAVQQAKDEANAAKDEVSEYATQAEEALQTIRSVAAEQGVSQQAIHFQTEATNHDKEAKKWAKYTVWISIGLGIFAILSIFIHKWPFLAPKDSFEMIQLGISKVLIFGVIGFMLVLSARNFMAHKHNAVVNRHRKNALVTFKALVEAATADGKQDIILTHAADCIFSGRDTAFSKSLPQSANSAGTILQMLPRAASSSLSDSIS
jgi:hypothetical protein